MSTPLQPIEPKRGFFSLRRWLWLSLGLVFLAIFLLPSLLGRKWVYQPILDRLRADDFQVDVDQVQLHWFGQLSIRGIRIRQENGPVLVSIPKVSTSQGMLGYLLGGKNLGTVTLHQPTIDIRLLSESSNLQKLIKALEGSQGAAEPNKKAKPALDLQLALLGLSAKVSQEGDEEPLVIVPPFDLQLTYRGAQAPAELIVAPSQILDHVELRPELMQLGLGHAVPLLANSAWFDGRISLATQTIRIPLDSPVDTTGSAILTMHQVRSGPSDENIIDALDWIAQMRGRETQHEFVFVDGSEIELEMHDRQLHHTGLAVGLPRVDPRLQLATSGDVGLESRQLDLELKIPIPLEQLAKRTPIKQLGVPTIGLPIHGTLDKPQIDWTKLRGESAALLGTLKDQLLQEAPNASAILGTLENLTKGSNDEAIAAAADFVKQLRAKRKARPPANEATEPPSTNPPEKRPLRDALRDFLRGGKNSEETNPKDNNIP